MRQPRCIVLTPANGRESTADEYVPMPGPPDAVTDLAQYHQSASCEVLALAEFRTLDRTARCASFGQW